MKSYRSYNIKIFEQAIMNRYPQKEAERIIRNFKKNIDSIGVEKTIGSKLTAMKKSAASVLFDAFSWANAKQSFNYWNNIYIKLQKPRELNDSQMKAYNSLKHKLMKIYGRTKAYWILHQFREGMLKKDPYYSRLETISWLRWKLLPEKYHYWSVVNNDLMVSEKILQRHSNLIPSDNY